MAILAFQKPEKVIMLEATASFGKFEFRPLEPGYGMTVGNALRRVLLSSLEGYAITTVKVAGVNNEFAAIPGVMEGMMDIILKLKQVRFLRTVDNQDSEKVTVNVAGVTELTAGYISNYLSSFKVLNPELVICHLAPGTKMQITITIGNALRRVLLSSLEGYAITTVKVAGVNNEFAAIPGVMEDMMNIILKLKQIRFLRTVDNEDFEKITVNVAGVTELTAGYISNYLSLFKVLNPELVICHLAPGTKMQITITIGKGRGYVPSEENAPADNELDVLPIDSIFTPIKNVKYSIEDYRVEQKTDYEKLNLEITTDGSIHPKEALKEAAKILIQHFMLFSDEKITINMDDNSEADTLDDEALRMRQLLKTKLSDQDLSVRALNCLKAADVDTVGDLVKLNRNDLLKFRNFGKKSLTELDELLASLNLKFGMDVSLYKLDKE